MFKAGAIRKITVTDFVTYSYAEMLPGPNLNMLIGPNGTGKSTIVAAVILGLGGSPKTVGRGTKISEYIKHNCTEATIEIELQDHAENQFIYISRNFNLEQKSFWTLNNKKVPFKEVETMIKQFNIQVDNLCQFLPQDKVQDFAKMNKQQLLQQTQIAICRKDLIDKQLYLIDIREKHKELQASIANYNQKLQELQDANVRIEGRITNLKKKKKYLKYIENVDRKVAWVKHQNFKRKVDEIKTDKDKATEVLRKHKEACKPIENAITNARRAIATIQEKVTNNGQIVRRCETTVQTKLEAYAGMKNLITKALGDFNSRLREIERRDQEISEATEQINTLLQNKTQILETLGDDAERERKIRTYNDNIKLLSNQINKLIEKKGDTENTKRNNMYEMRSFENELAKLENVKQQRLERLRRMDKDAYTAVQWLRSNKHMFKGEVYEPMMLELNVLNPQHAIFIENVIPIRDKIAFTCELKEDMTSLIQLVREQLKLSINIVHSGREHASLQSYQPVVPIEQLRPFGMFAYIRSLLTGPEPIMKYLCKTYHIHNIPVGSQQTNQCFEDVPQQISSFFSDTFRFSTSYSKYTRQKSSRQYEIRSDGSLAISLDTERMEHIRIRVTESQNESRRCDEQMHGLDVQIEQFNEHQRKLRESLKQFQKCKQDIQGIDSRIRVFQTKIEQLQQHTASREQLQNECDKRIHKVIENMVIVQGEIKTAFRKLSTCLNQSKLDTTNFDTARKQITFLENKSQDILLLCAEAQETLNHINEALVVATHNAKGLLKRAKDLSKGFTPDDEEFNEFRDAYTKLGDNVEDLEGEKEHVVSKIDCLNAADVGELQEYEQRQQQIEKLRNDSQSGNAELLNIDSNMDTLHREWLEPLQEVVDEINIRFSTAFKRMGCAGEVSISTGDNDKNFAEYGLSIKVKYRDTDSLLELNNIVQSGGERAVATAAFMLSLQELTPVPFRCVDEINQGMDSNNERRIFELLVEATSQPDTSQYFFITPKLVPHLKFVKTMNIHIVHNGPFVPPQQEWNTVMSSTKRAVGAY